MNSTLLRNLIIGNLAIYTLVATLIAYAYFFRAETTSTALDSASSTNNVPFISITLSTPTPFPIQTIPFGGRIPTVIPHETPIPVTPVAQANTKPILPVVSVRDQQLVPPSAINILLMGTDQRPGQAHWRTDVLVLVSVNQQDKTVALLTIPRDLYVEIPGIGWQRINTADFYGEYYHFPGGGPNLLKQTIEQNLGVRVHYYVRVGFEGFRKAVDLLGGIEVAVDCPLYEENFYDDYGRVTLNFRPGVQTMDGVTALRYARSRYTSNDYDRGRRQRQVLLAMWDKALSLNLLPKWPELYQEMRNSIQTDLGPVELAALAYIGSQLKMDKIKARAIDSHTAIPYITPQGAWVLLPNAEKIHALLVDLFSPFTDEVDHVAAENARILVTGGNPIAAQVATVFLKRQGLDAIQSRDSVPLAAKTTITMQRPKPTTAQRVAMLLHIDPGTIHQIPDPASPYDIVVNLGRDYNTCQR